MTGTKNTEHDPIYMARRLFGEGQGVESDPFKDEPISSLAFKYEMELLQLDDAKREAESP
jgi:hypothetical protein